MPLSFKVYDPKGEFAGTIREDKAAGVVCGDDCVKDFAIFFGKNLKDGITAMRDVDSADGETSVLVEAPVAVSDQGFALAFKEYLERQGYDVLEEHPEILEEIKNLINALPETDTKTKLLEELPGMNYLEQTLLLEVLRSKK